MTHVQTLWVVTIAAILVGGCSTKPRTFEPHMAAPVADSVAFQSDLDRCRTLAARGVRGGFKDAAALVGAGTAGTAAGIGVGMTSLAGSSLSAAGAAASVAMPVLGIGAAWIMSRAIRAGKERKLNQALGNCLGEYGYTVSAWTKAPRSSKKPKAQVLNQANEFATTAAIPEPENNAASAVPTDAATEAELHYPTE